MKNARSSHKFISNRFSLRERAARNEFALTLSHYVKSLLIVRHAFNERTLRYAETNS
jgi:hypothetical protein